MKERCRITYKYGIVGEYSGCISIKWDDLQEWIVLVCNGVDAQTKTVYIHPSEVESFECETEDESGQ